MTRKLLSIIGLLVFALLFTWTITETVSAAPRRSSRRPVSQATINEDKRPWPGTPWLIGGALTAGAFVVGLKNAKRTHLD